MPGNWREPSLVLLLHQPVSFLIQQLEDGLLSTMSRHWGQIKAFISFLLLRWGAGVHLAHKKPMTLEQAGCLRGDTAQHSTMSHIHTGPERKTR